MFPTSLTAVLFLCLVFNFCAWYLFFKFFVRSADFLFCSATVWVPYFFGGLRCGGGGNGSWGLAGKRSPQKTRQRRKRCGRCKKNAVAAEKVAGAQCAVTVKGLAFKKKVQWPPAGVCLTRRSFRKSAGCALAPPPKGGGKAKAPVRFFWKFRLGQRRSGFAADLSRRRGALALFVRNPQREISDARARTFLQKLQSAAKSHKAARRPTALHIKTVRHFSTIFVLTKYLR